MRAILATANLSLAAFSLAAALGAAEAAETPSAQPAPAPAPGPAAAPPAPAKTQVPAGKPLPAQKPPDAGQSKTPPAGAAAKKPDVPAKGKPAKAAEYKGPTEQDIRVAYTLRIDRINAGTAKNLSPEKAALLNIRVVRVDFIECDPVDERTDLFACNIVVESALGAGEPDFKRVEAVLAKEGKVWTMR